MIEVWTKVRIIDPVLASIFGTDGVIVIRAFHGTKDGGTRLLWYYVRIGDDIIPCHSHQIEVIEEEASGN